MRTSKRVKKVQEIRHKIWKMLNIKIEKHNPRKKHDIHNKMMNLGELTRKDF